MWKRLRNLAANHQLFFLILFLFVVFRLLAVLLFRPGGFITDASDYDFYMVWGELTSQGYRAYDNLWTAYPPLFPLIMLPIYELSSRIPPWIEPRLFFHTLFGFTLLLFETGNLILIYRLAIKLKADETDDQPLTTNNRQPSTAYQLPSPLLSVLLYALLFTPVFTLLGWFEPMPLFFMLLGLDLLLNRTNAGWIGSAAVAALGFLTKLTPILLLPIAVRWLGSKLSWEAARAEWFNPRSAGNLLRPIIYTLLFMTVVVAVGYPVVRHNPALAFSSFQIQGLRPPWQSIWALIDGFHGYGLVPIDMRNLVALETRTWETRIPWTLISIAFVAIWLWLYTRRYDWTRVRTPISFAAVSVIALFLYSKGWSPQFLVWILAFVVLLLPNWHGMVIGSLLALLNAIESHIFLVLLSSETWILWMTVLVRTVLLLLLAIEFLAQIWPHTGRMQMVSRTARALSWVTVAIALLLIPLSLPRAAQAYQDRRLAEHPCAEAIPFLEEEAVWPNHRIVTEQVDLWRHLYPWLRDDYEIQVVDVYSPVDEPASNVALRKLNAIAADGEFWWLSQAGVTTTAGGRSSAETFFVQTDVSTLEKYTFGPCELSRVAGILPDEPLASFEVAGGPIQLHATEWQVDRVGNSLYLVLYWQADEAVAESYTVFTQLFDSANQLIAQKDNLPVTGLAPTTTWAVDKLIRDPYELTRDAAFGPGQYTLLVGLYQNDQRVQMTTQDGNTADAYIIDVNIESVDRNASEGFFGSSE